MRPGARSEGRRDGLLPVVCWCERQMRPMTETDVWDGAGWSCGPGCVKGCRPYNPAEKSHRGGRRHNGGRPRKDAV